MTDVGRWLCCALSLVFPGASASELSHDRVLELRRQGQLLPFEEIISLVTERHPDSRILEVELEEDDGRYLYELEILTATDQVRELELDARTGAVLEDELED